MAAYSTGRYLFESRPLMIMLVPPKRQIPASIEAVFNQLFWKRTLFLKCSFCPRNYLTDGPFSTKLYLATLLKERVNEWCYCRAAQQYEQTQKKQYD